MRRFLSFLPILAAPLLATAAAPPLGWERARAPVPALDELVRASDLTVVGESHGLNASLAFYRGLFGSTLAQVDTVFLEWVFQDDQPVLDAYLQDKDVSEGGAREAYYICRLARMGTRVVKGAGKLTEERFNAKFARELRNPLQLTRACDHFDGMLETLRVLRKRSQAGNLKVCAIDFDGYVNPLPFAKLSERVKAFGKDPRFQRFFDDTEKADRELVLAEQIHACVRDSRKALGLLGAAHTRSDMATGMVKELLGARKTSSIALQVAHDQDAALPSREDSCGCIHDDPALQKQLARLKESTSLRTRDLGPEQKKYISSVDDGEALRADLLIFHPPSAALGDTLPPAGKKLVEKYFNPQI